jgi:hypothetical protein
MLESYDNWREAWCAYIANDSEDDVLVEFLPTARQVQWMESVLGDEPVQLWYGTGDEPPAMGKSYAGLMEGNDFLNAFEQGVQWTTLGTDRTVQLNCVFLRDTGAA